MNNLDKQFTHPYFPDHTFSIEEYHDRVVIDGVEFTFNNMAQLMGQYQWTLKDIDVNVLLSMAFNQNKDKDENI
jgi:hypothetical protein